MKCTTVGKLVRVQELSKNDNVTIYALTVGEKNAFKQKQGEYAGSYGRTFVEGLFFANTQNKVDFIENTVKPLVAGKDSKDFTPVKMDLTFHNNNYANAEEKVYKNEFHVEQFVPFL